MATYTDPEPASGAELISVSQPLITGNFTYLKQSYGKDHNFTSTSNTSLSNADGYHTVIHQVTQVGNPATIAGVSQVYSKNYTPNYTGAPTDTQLFNITGGGGVSQLTGTSAASEGWVWNGMLFQWGAITGKSGSWPASPTLLTFKDRPINGSGPASTGIPFPNNCFVIITNLIGPFSTSTGTVIITAKNATSFSWEFTGSSSASFDGFYWMAIGI